MENLFAWVPLLMATELFGFGMTEATKKHWVTMTWFLVSSVLAFALAVYLNSAEGLNRLRFIVRTPPIAWYIIVTAVAARVLCFIENRRSVDTGEKRTKQSINLQTCFLAALLWVALFLTNQALHPAQTETTTEAMIPSPSASPPISSKSSVFFDPYYKGKQPPKSVWQNEPVPLDGYDYENCKLTNVTITYNGDTPIRFSNCSINSFTFSTNNPSIYSALVFLNAAGLIKPPGSPLGTTSVPSTPVWTGSAGSMFDFGKGGAGTVELNDIQNYGFSGGITKGKIAHLHGKNIINAPGVFPGPIATQPQAAETPSK